MSRKVFTAGEVLAAADVNSFLMDQSVMSFAGTAARGSAIPSPVTGMTTYLEDTKDLQIYDGSAYNSALGLVLVKKQTIGSAVASVTVSDVFSAAYDDYKIIITGGVGSTALNFTLQLGSATTGYYSNLLHANYTSNTPLALVNNNGSNIPYVGGCTSTSMSGNIEVHSPFLELRTSIYSIVARAGVAQFMGNSNGFQNESASYTSFTIAADTGTFTGGTIYVYGYRKA